MESQSEIQQFWNNYLLLNVSQTDHNVVQILSPPQSPVQMQNFPYLMQVALQTTPIRTVPNPVNMCSFPGSYGFRLQLQEEEKKPAKTCSWTYSSLLNKIFVQRCVGMTLNYTSDFPLPPHDVQFFLIYEDEMHQMEPVSVCPRHVNLNNDPVERNHLILSEDTDREYGQCTETERYFINFRKSSGRKAVTMSFQCVSSCKGGINKEKIALVCVLYVNNDVVGQDVVKIKICCSPGRDREREEKRYNDYPQKRMKKPPPVTTPAKKSKVADSDDVSSSPETDKICIIGDVNHFNPNIDLYLGLKRREDVEIIKALQKELGLECSKEVLREKDLRKRYKYVGGAEFKPKFDLPRMNAVLPSKLVLSSADEGGSKSEPITSEAAPSKQRKVANPTPHTHFLRSNTLPLYKNDKQMLKMTLVKNPYYLQKSYSSS